MRYIFVILLGALALLAEDSMADGVVSNFAPNLLSAAQINSLKAEANGGDKKACMRLASYYLLVKADFKSAASWCKKLADVGDADGAYGYGYCLMHLGEFADAEKWLTKAKDLNHPDASYTLDELAIKKKEATRKENTR